MLYFAVGVTVENKLCSNYGVAGECCTPDWDATAKVVLCDDSGHGGSFYVYQFEEPPGCPMAICVEDHPIGKVVLGNGGSFYVYQFEEPPGCPMAICMEDHPIGQWKLL